MLKKILIGLSVLFGISLVGLYFFYKSVVDEVDDILHHKLEISSVILDRNDKKIANIVGDEYRLYVKFEDIPPKIIEALLAIEDTTFFEHRGINLEAIFRAVIKDIVAMDMVEGASTITQQFVRNTVLTKKKTIYRKIKEIFLALEVEQIMTKEEILERYLNTIYFGSGYYGIRTAAWGYFHKNLEALTLKEIAILVGLIKAPSFYDPTKNYEYSIGRANRVIERMYSGLGWISREEYERAINEKPEAKRRTKTENVAPYVTDYVMKKLTPLFPDLKSGGYVIHTNIDLDIQEIARKALKHGYERIVNIMKQRGYEQERIDKLNGAMLVLKQRTGEILAMVGGVSYKKSAFNVVTQGRRQIGSSIKPFFYQIGVNLGYSGASILYDVQKTYDYVDSEGNEKKWKPHNYSEKVAGKITLRDALVRSRNLATIDLVDKLGANNFYKELIRYGFTDIQKDMSIALGSYATSMFNLARQYTIISNYGTKVEPILIRDVEKDGKVVFHQESNKTKINEPKQAYLIIDIMKDVVKRGTGRKARIPGIELAGKTGTTNSGRDIWFNSFTPDIQAHVWFGNNDNTPILGDKKHIASSALAVPVAKEFWSELKKIRHFEKRFPIPQGVYRYRFNGRIENFTDISRPPVIKDESSEDSLLF
ncbi:MAG TPA: PBP1A family penicillin-binding protein [Campylobacterales bacterium]|nr:PBP1A family penicillin-binding protein [Campylobacterales bacterium]HIO71374.1 PBP1A family penicillin-binding protein [Campylobacterales bacterium]